MPHPVTAAPADASWWERLPTEEFWFDRGWKVLLTILVGALVLALVRTFIAHTVRGVSEGRTALRRRARVLLAKRRTEETAATSPLVAARRALRANTISVVLQSVVTVLVVLSVITVVLGFLGVDLAPILASAGVVGVALGFGAQTLVKDYLAGISMLIEDQYGIGDVVDLGIASGVVEDVGLRVTQVRDLQGTLWYVRNGEVLRVGNKTQGWSRAVVEVRVATQEDTARVTEVLLGAAARVAADPALGPMMLDDAEVAGIEDLTADSAMLRLMVRTAPAHQWDVARALRAAIREDLSAAGIAMVIPQREVFVGRAPVSDDADDDRGALGSA